MQELFSKIFHHLSATEQKVFLGARIEEIPIERKTTYYKEYPRLPFIALAGNHTGKNDVFEAILERKSTRKFGEYALTKNDLAALLKYACGNTDILTGDRRRRAYPSAGARYPIEVYPIVFRGNTEVPAGVYHYSVRRHGLEALWAHEFALEEIKDFFIQPELAIAPVLIIMTAVFWRNQNKYQERGYRQILIESGHVGQNIYLVSQPLGLKCVALSGVVDRKIEELLDIDGVTESVVYAIAIGK